MVYIVTVNEIDQEHLATVVDQMIQLGAPTIRVVKDEAQGLFVALEGSHRLQAAASLGLTPVLKVLDHDDMIDCQDIGYDDCGWFEGNPASAWDIAERIGRPMGTYQGCPILKFDEVIEA